jgi:hypothetical protein
MAMEVEYVDMGAEDIGEVAVSDMAAADIVNGAGEVVVERDQIGVVQSDGVPVVTITQFDEAGKEVTTSLRVEGDVEVQMPERINQGEDDWVEHSPESETATAENPPLVDPVDEIIKAGNAIHARHKAEWQHEIEIAKAKESHTQASLARQAAEEVFKAAKATEKACLSELSALINRGPDYPKPIDPNINQGGDPSDPIAAAVRNDKDSRPIPVDDPNADQSWRAIPTSEILDGIKGMGDKKRDAILSLIPTMGDFEDLRGQASVAHKPFRSVLPKGVGQGMADEIEERAITRMRMHQLSLEVAKPAKPAEEVNQVVEPEVEYEDAEPESNPEPEASTLVESESSTIDIDDV